MSSVSESIFLLFQFSKNNFIQTRISIESPYGFSMSFLDSEWVIIFPGFSSPSRLEKTSTRWWVSTCKCWIHGSPKRERASCGVLILSIWFRHMAKQFHVKSFELEEYMCLSAMYPAVLLGIYASPQFSAFLLAKQLTPYGDTMASINANCATELSMTYQNIAIYHELRRFDLP